MARVWNFYLFGKVRMYSGMMMMMIMMIAVYGWCLYSTQDEVLTHAVIPSLNDNKGKMYMLYS